MEFKSRTFPRILLRSPTGDGDLSKSLSGVDSVSQPEIDQELCPVPSDQPDGFFRSIGIVHGTNLWPVGERKL